MELSKALRLPNFKGSEGWLYRFKKRHLIVFKCVQGEAANINMEELEKWQSDILEKAFQLFSEHDVFNLDET